jgi:hypothetical protein
MATEKPEPQPAPTPPERPVLPERDEYDKRNHTPPSKLR